MLYRSLLLFAFVLSLPSFAQGSTGATLLTDCTINRIAPSFSSEQILAGKVHCVYGRLIGLMGSENSSLQEVFKNGKFKEALTWLTKAKMEIAQLGSLTEDDQLSVKAIDEVLAPKVLPPPAAGLTLGHLRDFHVGFLKSRK